MFVHHKMKCHMFLTENHMYLRYYNYESTIRLFDNKLPVHSGCCSLRDKVQVELLLRYIVEETPEDAEKKRIFRYSKVN